MCEAGKTGDFGEVSRVCTKCTGWTGSSTSSVVTCYNCVSHFHISCLGPSFGRRPARGYAWHCPYDTIFICFLTALTLTVHRSDCARKLNIATGAMDPAAEAELLAERRRVEQAEAQQGTFSRPFSFFSRPFHSFPPSFPLLTSIFSRPAAAVDRRAVARAPVALPLPRHLHLRPRRTSRMSPGRYVATWLHLFADVSSA